MFKPPIDIFKLNWIENILFMVTLACNTYLLCFYWSWKGMYHSFSNYYSIMNVNNLIDLITLKPKENILPLNVNCKPPMYVPDRVDYKWITTALVFFSEY